MDPGQQDGGEEATLGAALAFSLPPQEDPQSFAALAVAVIEQEDLPEQSDLAAVAVAPLQDEAFALIVQLDFASVDLCAASDPQAPQ